ncbi:MAG: pyridoxal phosphate-dependent aminotransferase [Firmicutes bacterium]|nr:pyridoxal phosphate-dependent aminotransferase [Bacillota bacterium]
MKYDFDKIINRKGTACIKYDSAEEFGKPAGLIPLWIADMDFRVADPILQALKDKAEFGILGYDKPSTTYFDAVSGWFTKRFGWTPNKEWLVITSGVVPAINTAVKSLTNEGDAIIIQSPVYYPFSNAINVNKRKLIESPLVLKDSRYTMDLDDFEKKIVENGVKLFIFCTPHNPVGRVWTLEELQAVGEICKKHNLYVVADEIHCDFIHGNHKHIMFIDACPELAERIVSCTAPSKTFNLAGLQTSNIWIPGEETRKLFNDELATNGFFGSNSMGLIACEAAYSQGEEWFDQCNEYIYENYLFLKKFIEEKIPSLRVQELEGTYLAWVDFSALGLSPEEVDDIIVNKAGIWLDEGKIFGTGGENFQRFILACPRATLESALNNLKAAINR